MLTPAFFYDALQSHGIDFFAGVPDSLLKDFCAYVTDHSGGANHIISANEGAAVALASGHYLATGRAAVVYMQNSGQGNAVNPLLSLSDPDVFGIPMLLLVGWRGEPGIEDEPQHVKQGKVTLDLFQAMGIAHAVLPEDEPAAADCLNDAARAMRATSAPYAIVVRTGTFSGYKLRTTIPTSYEHMREGALRLVCGALDPASVIVATTGKTSRELFELRRDTGATQDLDFRTVGCMGHSSQIALGIALARPDRRVVCLDGDGAVIMHMGSLAIIGTQQPNNLTHIVFNNGAHDSVGGQPTAGFAIDIPQIARACGYRTVRCASTTSEILNAMAALNAAPGPSLLEIRVNTGARNDLGRPTTSPASNKTALMARLRE